VFVIAESAQAVDHGDFRMVLGPNLGSGAAGRVLGRFADLIGEPAVDALRSAAEAESQVDPAILRTEVSYLPRQARLANVAIRPLVRERELAFGTAPHRPAEQVLRPDDLTVRLSHGRFVVRSTSAARDISPTAGHMLNTLAAAPIVRFLDEVSWDGITFNSGFDWGPAASFPFVPRVQSGRLVLVPATWRLGAIDADTPEEFATAFYDWRARWQLPQYVYLTMSDNRLLLDLDVPGQVGQLWTQYRKLEGGQPLILQEALPSPGHAWVTGPQGDYQSELVVPLVLAEPRPEQPVLRVAAARSTGSVSRSRPPGSDWLYAKLYHLPTYEDDLIAGPIRTFGAAALAAGADSWFFLRYADPEPHLRIRWQGDPGLLARQVAPKLLAWGNDLVAGGYCRRFLLDTYDQEVERYGGPAGIEPAEQLFATDSLAVADLLRLCTSRRLDLDRSLLAAITVERLLTAFGLDREARAKHYRDRLQDRKLTSEEFRREQNTLRSAIGDPGWLASRPGGTEAVAILDDWAARIAESATTLEAAELTHTNEELAHSFVHLHCNRLVGCGHPYEQRVLGLLDRTVESLGRAPWKPRNR
jgi:thiopeptide-type bacteriocin biosynthesis protein